MNKKTILLILLIGYLINIAYSNKYGIIIINSRYEDPTIEDLNYSKNVLKTMTSIYKKLNIPEENILKIYGSDGEKNTRNKIIKEIYLFSKKIESKIRKNDIIFFYYSGHGDYDIKNGKKTLYIVPEDAIKKIKETFLPLNLLMKFFDFFIKQGANIINIFDACYLGKQDIAEIPTFDQWITIGISEKTSDNILTKTLSDTINEYLKNPEYTKLTINDLYNELDGKIPGITVYPKVLLPIHSKEAKGGAAILIDTNIPIWMIKKGILEYSLDDSSWKKVPITKIIFLNDLSPGEHNIKLRVIRKGIEEKFSNEDFKVTSENNINVKIKIYIEILAKIRFIDKNKNILKNVKIILDENLKYFFDDEDKTFIIKSKNFYKTFLIKAYYKNEILKILIDPGNEKEYNPYLIKKFEITDNDGKIALFNFNNFSSSLLNKMKKLVQNIKVSEINSFDNLNKYSLLIISNDNWSDLYFIESYEKESIINFLNNGGKILSFYDNSADSFLLSNGFIKNIRSFEEYEGGVFQLDNIKFRIHSKTYTYLPSINEEIIAMYNGEAVMYLNEFGNGKIYICGIKPEFLSDEDFLYLINYVQNN
ncbi:hypothetical protein X275_00695 [Marinitoga sp. 1197]|uniref:caspase family protein n=1 Tax=Marinitoga sp. 1197 TaxID=1428449 RepID=UPI0006411458|nr:caspase family protein [Marinitoga sp. 1197]KLO24235.1 hypothetical protein X275_00695 [Marinitoga sp. 1197]